MKVKIKKIEDGQFPVYKREGDSAMDCSARLKEPFIVIPNGSRCKIALGFALEVPEGWKAEIKPRSGNSLKGLDVAEGTIDTNYRGEVSATLINHTGGDYTVNNMDRVCQLDFVEVPLIQWEQVEELSETVRGENGFGSTGR